MAGKYFDNHPLEQQIHEACDRAAYGQAATLILEGYGEELLSFVIARLGTPSDGREAFSIFAEDLWVGLPDFAFRCTARTWAYTLARNAASRYSREARRRDGRNLPISAQASLSVLVDRVRTQTELHQQTGAKHRIRALRDRLAPEDQMLLVLRVDRSLTWRDLARIMGGDSDCSDGALDRQAARYRKRFERLKLELRRMAEADGLLAPKDPPL